MIGGHAGRQTLKKEISLLSDRFAYTNVGEVRAINAIGEYLEENSKMEEGRAIGLLNKSIPLYLAKDHELFHLAEAFNHVVGGMLRGYNKDRESDERVRERLVKISEYFTEVEIAEYAKCLIDTGKKRDFSKLVFSNVDKVSDNHYISTMTPYQYIADLVEAGAFEYNSNTQRQSKYVEFRGDMIKEPYISKRAISEIKDSMVHQEFISDPISFNIRKLTGMETSKFQYYPLDRVLEVEVDRDELHFDIIDGMHRALGMVGATTESPQLNRTTMVNIFYFTEDEAKKYIIQQSKRTLITRSHIKSMDSSNKWMELTKSIDGYGSHSTNRLYHTMATTRDELKHLPDKRITFELFAYALENSFVNYEFNLFKIKKYIVTGMQLIHHLMEEYCEDELGDIPEGMIMSEGAIVGYISILGLFYGNSTWEEDVEKLISSSHYQCPSPDSVLWKEMGAFNREIKPKTVRKIRKEIGGIWQMATG